MAYLKRPQKGDKVLQSLFDSVNSIIDYLPTITVRGDNYSTYVEHSNCGTVIHAKQPYDTDQTGKGSDYYAGSGIIFTSGNIINAKLSAGPNIKINYNSGYLVISGTPAGSGSSGSGNPPSDGRFNTIGAENSVNSTLSGSGTVAANLGLHTVDPPPNYYITINETAIDGYNLISCDLTHLTQLYNYDLVADSQASVGIVNTDHYVKALDFFLNSTTGHRGLGTEVNLFRHSLGNTVIDPQTGEQHLVNPIMGLKVDLTVSGGNWIGVSAVPRQIVGFDVDPQELQINCLLTGTYDHYPHTSGFIDIVPTIMEDGQTWGVISTNLHAGSGIAIDQQTGQISVTGTVPSPTPGGGFDAPNYDNLAEQCSALVYPLMRYSTSTGGWLRISLKSGSSRCVGYWVNDNYIGLGQGIMTWIQPIPAGVSFYVDVDYNVNSLVWFDSTVTPSKVTRDEWNYWLMPPQWDENQYYISEVKNYFNNARSAENSCRNFMNGAEGNLNSMINDWTKYEHLVQSDPSVQPQSLDWYSEVLGYINDKFNDCSASFDSAVYNIGEAQTLYETLPSTNAMYDYQFADIPVKCQQYCDQIQQYITSGQYYYDLAEQYWQSQG